MQNLTRSGAVRFVKPGNVFGYLPVVTIKTKDFYAKNNKRCFSNFPSAKQISKQFQKDFWTIQNLLLKKADYGRQIGSRGFRTTSSSSQNDPQKGKDPNKDDKDDKDKEGFGPPIFLKIFFWMMAVYGLLSFVAGKTRGSEAVEYISWNDFVHNILVKGEVQQVFIYPGANTAKVICHEGAIIKGRRGKRIYILSIADATLIEEKVRGVEKDIGIRSENGIPIVYSRQEEYYGLFFVAAIVVVIAAVISKFRSSKLMDMSIFSQYTRAKFTLVDPMLGQKKGVKFADVAGLKQAKIEVMEFVDYLKHPEHYKTLGAKVPKGALLLGPPGCGKTMLAKAVATEANVPFLSMNGSEFIEMIGGVGASRVRDLFKEGKKRAPSIIYIDEIDAIGKRRSDVGGGGEGGSGGESEQTLNQLLVEMDGMVAREDVIVLASTNRAEVLDNALLRPGRFDRHIPIELPTREERKQIFEQHLKGIVLDKEPSFYSPRLAALSPGFSGADIANVCNESALHAARDQKKKVDDVDLEYAIGRVVGGTEKKTHAMSVSEKEVVAYHEAGHALVGWLLEHTGALLKITIVPRTNMKVGFTQSTQPMNNKIISQEQMLENMCMMLGGRAAECIVFNKITTGAQDDLQRVTKAAYSQVQRFGMNDKIGLVSFDPESLEPTTKKPFSKKLARMMDEEARKIISQVYFRTEKLLKENRDKLELLAENLLKKETLSYEEIVNLIGPPLYDKKKLIDPIEYESSFEGTDEPTTNDEQPPPEHEQSPPEQSPRGAANT